MKLLWWLDRYTDEELREAAEAGVPPSFIREQLETSDTIPCPPPAETAPPPVDAGAPEGSER